MNSLTTVNSIESVPSVKRLAPSTTASQSHRRGCSLIILLTYRFIANMNGIKMSGEAYFLGAEKYVRYYLFAEIERKWTLCKLDAGLHFVNPKVSCRPRTPFLTLTLLADFKSGAGVRTACNNSYKLPVRQGSPPDLKSLVLEMSTLIRSLRQLY